MNRTKRTPVIGVVILEADHSVDTVDFADPTAWAPPAGLGAGFFGHPGAWPAPTMFAIADGATAQAAANAEPAAMEGVAHAVARLDGRCDLIVGGCGYFHEAWPLIGRTRSTPAVLSGLDFLEVALRSTPNDVAIVSFSAPPAQRIADSHPSRDRLRVLGISPAGDWPLIGRSDWATDPQWTIAGLEDGMREVLDAATEPGGTLDGVGALVVECTIVPQFRSVIREFTSMPIYDPRELALGLLA